ncbi:MAG: hypothetical protein Q8M16_23390 [Pirellulaceae bacterium]|nr:hypothetical protein [Pirellulaceae bacterium]
MERRAVRTGGLKWFWNGTIAGGLAIGWLAGDPMSASQAFGQTTEHVFGTNIHRYYEGNYEQLISDVSAIVNEDLEDPRVYYLRGLAFLKTGQNQAAADDLKKGAELEAIQFGKRNYNIARTMQRIQGNDRAMLEAARSDAMKRRSELRAAKAGIPRSQILADMGRSILDPPPMTASRPNLPDPSTLSDTTAPFGEGWDNAPRPRPTRTTQPSATSNEVTTPSADPFDSVEPTGAAESTGATDPFGGGAPPSNPNSNPNQSAGANDPFAEPANNDPLAQPAANNSAAKNVNGAKVLGKLFGALTSPIRRAAEQGANAVQNAPGVGIGLGGPPPTEFPGTPSELGNSPDPFGNR